MCEANVYLMDADGEEKLLMDAVDKVIPQEEKIYMENIYGERKTVKARIKEMHLVDHRIILE
ncbi:CooT family nickel-binding protein [Caproiciproducens sp. LBM24188]|nr:CooT family nickel-binding protein [Oscillospiraceae bacterium]HHV33004.1 CooT family nickel-binding protein [Clostridiales bacterium]